MKSRLSIALLFLTIVSTMVSCLATKMSVEQTEILPPVIVYKTRGDYHNLVPITLNESKDRVVSFPAPTDLFTGGKLALPLILENGYLFDRRGINANSAFTTYTYEEYTRMKSAPSPDKLLISITDPDPFVEIYNCGNINRSLDLEKELNKLIRKRFKGCVPL